MRLTTGQHHTIRQVVTEFFGPGARLLLFGSRTDDRRRGGDFDFYVEVSGLTEEEITQRSVKARSCLFRSKSFAGRKVDLVIRNRDSDYRTEIYDVATRTGVVL